MPKRCTTYSLATQKLEPIGKRVLWRLGEPERSHAAGGESLGMNLRRVVLSLTALALFVLGTLPVAAATDNPYWRVETTAPVETIDGVWTVADNGLTATVEFDGVNLPGQSTQFYAGWTSPWVKTTQSNEGEVSYLIEPFAEGTLVTKVRAQFKGQPWSGWFRGGFALDQGGGGYSWSGGSFASGGGLLRWQWKLVGEVDATAQIEGRATVSVE